MVLKKVYVFVKELEMTIKEALELAEKKIPQEIPQELRNACKCEPIDSAWPIATPREALVYLAAWELYDGQQEHSVHELTHRITHSHHYEKEDLLKYGVEQVYTHSLSTKYVSIGWHLSGRYSQDNGLIGELDRLGWPQYEFLDFGAAPWIQALFYSNKGLDVSIVNKDLNSDCNRFGRFMAHADNNYSVLEYNSNDNWDSKKYDVIYSVDVLEHIPPLPDGSPGWLSYAERLMNCWKVGGIGYLNAPFDIANIVKPVEYHPVHYTSPISLGDFLIDHGAVQEGYFWRKVI